MIVDCIGCLHGHYPKLEGGDLLIVTGDLTARDVSNEYEKFLRWVVSSHYKKIIWIGGNHDNFIQKFFTPSKYSPTTYLCDSGTEFEGLKIWGSPRTLKFKGQNPHAMAFCVDTEEELADKFEKIPPDTDILITHSPPYGILDKTDRGENVGSPYLYSWFKYVGRPKLHVFSHIHEAYGQEEVFVGHNNIMVKSINCSHVNELYQPVNKPMRVVL